MLLPSDAHGWVGQYFDTKQINISRKEYLLGRGWTNEQIEKHLEEKAKDSVDSLIYHYYIDGENVMFRCTICRTFEKACDEAKEWVKSFSGGDMTRRAYKILRRYKKSAEVKEYWRQRRFDAIEHMGWRVNRETGEIIEE